MYLKHLKIWNVYVRLYADGVRFALRAFLVATFFERTSLTLFYVKIIRVRLVCSNAFLALTCFSNRQMTSFAHIHASRTFRTF
ncbi:hypothetical protein PAECIP111893_02084 [Paenibacillus plantiphilus]|uniref:Uncharacterized protein n=1 Tax=Paenibacillus plantiphilus TaxID=2905650 RepID=A0ABM9C7E5_9BACL|nr:hypothetical protein PAECIP111893_02084 [Paenibacillus plantiphilus]